MTLVSRSSPPGELVKPQIPKAEAVKPRPILITPTTHEGNGSNGKSSFASGETTTRAANEPARSGA